MPAGQKANVVYNIPCFSCPRSYIGQTARLLDTRVREHKAAVKKGETATSAVAEHVWEEHHQMDFSNVTVLASNCKTNDSSTAYSSRQEQYAEKCSDNHKNQTEIETGSILCWFTEDCWGVTAKLGLGCRQNKIY